MNREDTKKIDACLQELAEILDRNTPVEELADFEGIEKPPAGDSGAKHRFFLSKPRPEQ